MGRTGHGNIKVSVLLNVGVLRPPPDCSDRSYIKIFIKTSPIPLNRGIRKGDTDSNNDFALN